MFFDKIVNAGRKIGNFILFLGILFDRLWNWLGIPYPEKKNTIDSPIKGQLKESGRFLLRYSVWLACCFIVSISLLLITRFFVGFLPASVVDFLEKINNFSYHAVTIVFGVSFIVVLFRLTRRMYIWVWSKIGKP